MKSKSNTRNLKEYAEDILKILHGEESVKKYKTAFCVILLISLFLELFIFNFRAAESIFNERVDAENYKVSGASEISDGVYRANGDSIVVEIKEINRKLKNVLVDIDADNIYTTVGLWAVDKANANGISAPEREIVSDLRQTKYIRTHFSGDVKTLRITLKNIKANSQFTLNGIAFDAKVPLHFSVIRFLCVLAIMMFLYTFRPKSFVYTHTVDLKKNWQRSSVIAFAVIQIVCIEVICNVNPAFRNPVWPHQWQYHELAEAFLNGHVYLDKEPSPELKAMENPYDYSLRLSEKTPFAWDHSYYNERYYVYFGVVPALIYHLPFKALTGRRLSNIFVIFINCSLACAATLALLYSVIKKWFKKTSFGVFMLTAITTINTCGIIYIAKRPDLYSIPIIMSILFAVFGLTLWINSEKTDKSGNTRISTARLAGGAVCMALIGGCRPHLLLTTVFGVIFFWNAVFKERILFSKSSIKNTMALCLPYVIIGVGLMIYNYVRFESPFDFGANYNLTTNDMTARGIVMDRNMTGIFYYFLQPPSVDALFPYIHMIDVKTMYQGLTLTEKMSGGLLWLAPLTLLGIRGLWKRKLYNKSDMRPYFILCAAVVMSIIISTLDAQVAGLLTRYYGDFSWLALFGAAIALFAEYNYANDKQTKDILVKILFACFIISIAATGLNIFNDVDEGVVLNNPEFYYKMKYLIGFLL